MSKIIQKIQKIDRRYVLLAIGTGFIGSQYGIIFGVGLLLILIAFLKE